MKEVSVISLPGSGSHYNGAGMSVFNLLKYMKSYEDNCDFRLIHAYSRQENNDVYSSTSCLGNLYPIRHRVSVGVYLRCLLKFAFHERVVGKVLLVVGDSKELIPFIILSYIKGADRIIVRTTINRNYSKFEILLRTIVYKVVDFVICISPSIQESNKEFVNKSKLIYIPNGVRSEQPTLKIPRDRKKIIFVGALNDRKNLHVAIRVFIMLANNRYYQNGWTFDIYGEIFDNNYINSLRKLTENYPQIRWQGFCSDKAKIFSDARLILLPSKREGMPNAVLEAMSYGVVPVISNFEGYEGVLPYNNDLIVDLQNDDESFIKEIFDKLHNLASDSNTHNKALSFVEEWISNFDYSKIAMRYSSLIFYD